MTSQITTANINGDYPIAGQNNSTQGFRDNFTAIKTNLDLAGQEITDLQNTAVLKNADTNDLEGSNLNNAVIQGFRSLVYDFGIVSGQQNYEFTRSSFQTMTLGGSVTLFLIRFTETSGSEARVRLQVNVPNTNYTLTLPPNVSQNLGTIAGLSGQTISFSAAGVYTFEFSTIDGGTTFAISDLSRSRTSVTGGYFAVETLVGGNVSAPGITMEVTNVGGVAYGNITATNFIGNIITTGNSATFTSNITANNVNAVYGIYGNIKTALQPNITLVGTLSSLSVTGNANVGNVTVSGLTDMCGGDAYGVQYAAATNAGSTQILSNVGLAILNPSGTISTHTLTMPAAAMNGQVIRIAFANSITTLTQAGAGSDTVYGGITTGNTAVGTTWTYYKNAAINSGNGAWYRIG
jgi:hypothetical protein